MTYEQELRRLYQLLVAADSQVLAAILKAPKPSCSADAGIVAEHISKGLTLVRQLIEEAGYEQNGTR